jgi:hypothetical protein
MTEQDPAIMVIASDEAQELSSDLSKKADQRVTKEAHTKVDESKQQAPCDTIGEEKSGKDEESDKAEK